jgi:hypothetical protein
VKLPISWTGHITLAHFTNWAILCSFSAQFMNWAKIWRGQQPDLKHNIQICPVHEVGNFTDGVLHIYRAGDAPIQSSLFQNELLSAQVSGTNRAKAQEVYPHALFQRYVWSGGKRERGARAGSWHAQFTITRRRSNRITLTAGSEVNGVNRAQKVLTRLSTSRKPLLQRSLTNVCECLLYRHPGQSIVLIYLAQSPP